jgi:predicted CXXCH cytochrome family protein
MSGEVDGTPFDGAMDQPPVTAVPSTNPADLPAPATQLEARSAAASPWRRARWWWLWGSIVLLAAGTATAIWFWGFRRPDHADLFPLPPIESSPYLNTTASAQYVGSQACRACHEGNHTSFRHTGMGRSSALLDAGHDPPHGSFDHAKSKRRYEIQHKDGVMWHRELLLTEGPEVVLSEYPVKYAVGSGRHAYSYLVEVDGFLVESPVAWYTGKAVWDMAPGYDDPRQKGFERAIGEGCLFCHTGRAEAVGQSTHRMHITEIAIGCERCHGPGSLHVQRHQDRLPGKGVRSGEIDFTIVNPAILSRDLAEAICQQCHLESDATVTHRGRKMADFRPGLRGQDFRQVYVLDDEDQPMTVVGHIEQMHRSPCYQGSKTFSCLTCHNPHGEPAEKDRVAHYKAICLDCHGPSRCKVDPVQLRNESPDNNCVQCHMPRSAVDVPHLAFTHHRVGIHRKPPAEAPAAAKHSAELRPFLDFPDLSPVDRKLSLGEGYRLLSIRDPDASRREQAGRRAWELLSAVSAAGLRDARLDAGLAQLSFQMKMGDPLSHAEQALADPGLTGQGRCDVLFVVAHERAARGEYAKAIATLEELTTLHREAKDWLYLSKYKGAIGDDAGSKKALLTAVQINPRLWEVQRYLADWYRGKGDLERAAWHQRRAVP